MMTVFKCRFCGVTNLLLDFLGLTYCKLCKTACVIMLTEEQILKEKLFEI